MAKTFTLADLLRLQFSTLAELDSATIARLEPVLRRGQEKLRDELDHYAKGTFTYTQKKHSLALINQSLVQIHNQNLSEMVGMSQDFNIFANEMANREVQNFQREAGLAIPNVKRDKVGIDQNSFLINNMKASLEKYSVDIRMKVSRALTDAVIQKSSGYEVSGRISKYILLKRSDAMRIVRTEMSRVYNATKHITYDEFNEQNFNGTLMKRMYHPMDNRTAEDSREWAKADPAIPMNQLFRLKLKSGKVQEGLYPPLRPNDRAVLMPFHKSWKND